MGLCFIPKSVGCKETNAPLGYMNLKMRSKSFFEKAKNNLCVQLPNEEFVVMLSHMANVFGHLNDMKLSLQGRDVTVSDVKDKLAGITARIGFWQTRIKIGFSTSFPLFERCPKMNMIDLPDNIKTCIIEHLEIVSAEFRSYFSDDILHVSWYRDQFNTEIDPNAKEAEELAEFKVLNAMKLAFNNKTDDSSFWLSLHDSCPLLSKKASVILVQFATTYFCEAEFSDLASMKTKFRNRLNVCSDICLAHPKTEQNIKGLFK